MDDATKELIKKVVPIVVLSVVAIMSYKHGKDVGYINGFSTGKKEEEL